MEIEATMLGHMDKIAPPTRYAGRNQVMIGEYACCDLKPRPFALRTALAMRRRKPIYTMFRMRNLSGYRIGLSRL